MKGIYKLTLDKFLYDCQVDFYSAIIPVLDGKQTFPSKFFCVSKKKWLNTIDHVFFTRAQESHKTISEAEIDELYRIAYDLADDIFKIVFDSL